MAHSPRLQDPPTTLAELLAWGQAQLAPRPAREARLLIAHVLACDPIRLLTEDEMPVTKAQAAHYKNLIARRVCHEPVARLIRRRAFWQHTFLVTRDVLDPRPDSETLIETALEARLPDQAWVLDLGTGSGCLLLSLLQARPDLVGVGVDVCPRALKVARYNASQMGLTGRATFHQGDWRNPQWSFAPFHAILSNPPYIRRAALQTLAPEVRLYDPVRALDGGKDGLTAYRQIIPRFAGLLHRDGAVFIEVGAGQSEAVTDMMRAAGLDIAGITQDLGGHPRCIHGIFRP
ncbi:MAG: peptide chain release factor N(5)-glutamine methyltransferase [Pseudomonadota bacterium]